MDQQGRGRKSAILSGMIGLAILYGVLLVLLKTLTGNPTLDGAAGVLLGLYICSHPSANLVDMIFFARSAGFRALSRRAAFGWLALNLAAFIAGWLVIVAGTTRFINQPH
jgi:hypothetical protein